MDLKAKDEALRCKPTILIEFPNQSHSSIAHLFNVAISIAGQLPIMCFMYSGSELNSNVSDFNEKEQGEFAVNCYT